MPILITHPFKLDPQEIREGLSLSQESLSRLLNVSSKTITRWEKEHKQPKDIEVKKRLVKLKEIQDLGLSVYTPEGFKEFLYTPLPIFDGRTAIEQLLLGEYKKVLGALAADWEGTGF